MKLIYMHIYIYVHKYTDGETERERRYEIDKQKGDAAHREKRERGIFRERERESLPCSSLCLQYPPALVIFVLWHFLSCSRLLLLWNEEEGMDVGEG